MATPIFPFVFLRRGFREYLAYRTAVHEQGGGRRTVQKVHAAGELVVRGTLLFPNPGGAWRDFDAFWNARFGGYEPFLYRPQNPGAARMVDWVVSASATQKDFPASRRYVDTAKLVVWKGAVQQVLGTHYFLVDDAGGAYVLGTSKQLVVRFATAPGAGVVVSLVYEFLHMVRFEGDDLPAEQELEAGGLGGAAVADRTVAVQFRETGPGASYAAIPNAM